MSNEDVNRQLKSTLNRSFSQVAIQPIADLAPPKPVMQNPGMALMLGLGEAALTGIASNEDFRNKVFRKKEDDSSSKDGGSKKNQSFGTFGTSFGNYTDYSPNINWYTQ